MRTITGQQPVVVKARKSVAAFKLRAGMPVGIRATLRGRRMWYFLEKLVVVALPRMAFLISSGSWTGDLRKRLSHHGVPTFGADS